LRFIERIQVLGVPLDRDEHMAGVDVANVQECKHVVVFVHASRRNLARDDSAEYTVSHAFSPIAW
jgi:hypothetical protein